MRIKLSVVTDINIPKHLKAVTGNQFGTFAASEWHRLYLPYVPFDTGILANQVNITPWEIEHTAPYAQYQYYSEGHHFNRSIHPKASAKWDKAAAATQKINLYRSLQNYVNSGNLDL